MTLWARSVRQQPDSRGPIRYDRARLFASGASSERIAPLEAQALLIGEA